MDSADERTVHVSSEGPEKFLLTNREKPSSCRKSLCPFWLDVRGYNDALSTEPSVDESLSILATSDAITTSSMDYGDLRDCEGSTWF